MNYIRQLNGFFARLDQDKRMSSYHISLYFALFQQWNEQRFAEQFTITRGETMELSRLGSLNTYARCMKELTEWGYIRYNPSSNLHAGSRVTCIRFDTAGDTASDTASDTGTENDTAGGTASDTASSTSIRNDTARNTTTDTTRSTDTSSDLKSDTGSSTAGDTARDTGIENDTAGDTARNTASDTPFINITNKNKQEESSKRNSKEKDSEEGETPNKIIETKTRIPEFEVIKHFFEQNQSSTDEAQKFYARYQSSGWKTGDMKAIVSWQAVARKWIENNQNNQTDEREHNQNRTGKLSVTVNKNYHEPL
ncbi:MAG: hypothetical protein JNK09_10430 [Prolixibacteraceae bacterium]|nr:hypothetical protein [Prolixibacteraceae bacterium]